MHGYSQFSIQGIILRESAFSAIDGHDRSFAELAPAEKNAISHRGRALAALRAAIHGVFS